jgi:hypothetical protein
MAEFSWAYIDSEAVVKVDGPTGSIQYRVADSDGHTVMSGSSSLMWHTASSALEITGDITASAFSGDGAGLTNVSAVAAPAGSNTQMQFNNAGSLGASANLTWNGSQVTVVGNVTASAFSGDGSGLTGITVPVTPAGSNTEIQFNNAGSLGASSGLTWDATTLAVSGALDISGSVSRQGFLQLGINAEQAESIVNLNTTTPTGLAFPVSWNDVVRKDDSFYSFVGTVITLAQAGDYKVSYSINFSQELPDNARSSMRSWIEISPTGGGSFVELSYSRAHCYIRGSGDTAWGGGGGSGTTRFGTNTITTILTGTTANDELKLNFADVGGISYGAWDMRLPAYETWITIEKI